MGYGQIWGLFRGSNPFISDADSNPSEDYILTINPLIADQDWEVFLNKLGLGALKNSIQIGQTDPIVHDDFSYVFLEIDTKENEPKSTISIETTLWGIGLIIKQDQDGRFILDDAYINEKPLRTRGWIPSEPITNIVPVENDAYGKDILPKFLKLFSEIATQIYTRDDSVTADEIESRLEEELKPLVRQVIILERDFQYPAPSQAENTPQI